MSPVVEDTPSGRGSTRRRAVVWTMGAGGLAVALALVIRSGLPEIAALLRVAGWRLLWLAPLHLVPLALDASGWRRLLPAARLPGRAYLTGVAVVRETASTVLPLRVGGEVAGIRLLMRHGVGGIAAGASVVVEVTMWLLAQTLFALVGLALLIGLPGAGDIPRYASMGLLLVAAAIAGFVVVQRRVGLFVLIERLLARIAGREVIRAVGDPRQLDAAIIALYGNRRALVSCVSWQFAGFLVGAFETWITFRLLGRPIGLAPAVIVESLSLAVQSATFVVPAGLGTQEAGLVLLGAAVGIPGTAALALSMARRARQLALGVPALLVWYWGERRSASGGGQQSDVGGQRPLQ